MDRMNDFETTADVQQAETLSREEWFKKYAGRYLLTKFMIGKNDLSEAYIDGWKDKSRYMFFEITDDGKFILKAHAGETEKEYEYFFEPDEMKYHQKADLSDEGTPITIENGVIREETSDHLMVYELTDELG